MTKLEQLTSTHNYCLKVFRHGDRNPTESYPTDPYQNYSWPDGLGALTKVKKYTAKLVEKVDLSNL